MSDAQDRRYRGSAPVNMEARGQTHYDPVEANAICHPECAIALIKGLRQDVQEALAGVNQTPTPAAVAELCARLHERSGPHPDVETRLHRNAAAMLASLSRALAERDTADEDAVLARTGEMVWESRAIRAEHERDAAVNVLRRWLQLTNLAKGDTGATVADWDELRQQTHAIVQPAIDASAKPS